MKKGGNAVTIDEALRRIAAGERDALEEVYRQTRKTVYYVALSVVRERMLAEDVMQTTYLKVLANAARYRAGSNARAWIVRIAKNEAIALWRRRRREVSVDEREELALFGAAADEYGFLIDLARRILKEKEFAVLMLSAAEGYKRREIAEILSLPLPTVTWHYGRAVEKMQRALREQESPQGGGRVDRNELERELRSEAERHTPDVYGRIRSAQAAGDAQGEVLAAARPNRLRIVLSCVLAAVLLCLAVLLPIVLRGGGTVGLSGTVYISINPAVEFIVEDDRVTGVKALNRDAALLVAGEEFIGLSPEDAGEKFVALSETKHLITAQGVGVRGEGADGAALEQRVRDRLADDRYAVHELGQTELDALIAAYDEQAMGDFEDYLERELGQLREDFATRVHALLDEQTYASDLQTLSAEEFNAKYLYLGEDCIYEEGDEDPRELLENFRELKEEIARHGDGYIFDELFDEFLEAVEELYEPDGDDDHDDDDDGDDDDDHDDDDDDDDDDD